MSAKGGASRPFFSSGLIGGLIPWLAAITVVLPFLIPVHRPPQPIFDSELASAFCLCLLALCLAFARGVEVRINWPFPLFLGLFGLVCAYQFVVGRFLYAEQFYYATLYLLAAVGAYVVGCGLRSQPHVERTWSVLGAGIVIGCGISVLTQVLQALDVRALPFWLLNVPSDRALLARPPGNVGQSNVLATFYCWGLVVLLGLAARSRNRGAFVATLGAAATLAAGLAMSLSRMGALFLLLLVVVPWWRGGLSLAPWKRAVAWMAALALGYFAGNEFLRWAVLHVQGVDALSVVDRFGASNYGLRLRMWADALAISFDNPLVGVGFGSYGAAQYWYSSPDPSLLATAYVHNIVLQVAAELGWPTACALVALLCWWFLSRLRERIGRAADEQALLMMLFIVAHSMLEWPLWSLIFLVPTCMLFGMFEPASAERPGFQLDRRSVGILSVAGAVMALLIASEFHQLSRAWVAADRAIVSRQSPDEMTMHTIESFAQASKIRPFAERLLVLVDGPNVVDSSPEGIAALERALWQGSHPVIATKLVIAHALAGNPAAAQRHADRFKTFHPSQYEAWRLEMVEALKASRIKQEGLRTFLQQLVGMPTG